MAVEREIGRIAAEMQRREQRLPLQQPRIDARDLFGGTWRAENRAVAEAGLLAALQRRLIEATARLHDDRAFANADRRAAGVARDGEPGAAHLDDVPRRLYSERLIGA